MGDVGPEPRKALVVCGPTASGKSDLADDLAERLTELHGPAPTIVVDSMQVYRELPLITNQARRRPAELVAVVSVTEEWTVARHRDAALGIVDCQAGTHFVLDAGTGMYLNAILLEIPLAPRVPPGLRRLAQQAVAEGEGNPRRAARAKELEMAGAGSRGSIWEGRPRYDTTLLYLRPDRSSLDAAIANRSHKIAHGGLQEAERVRDLLSAGAPVNPSVLESVGVRELSGYLSGGLTFDQAEDRINVRTRQLARRQMRWFDKLARTLEGRAHARVLTNPQEQSVMHIMHDIIGA